MRDDELIKAADDKVRRAAKAVAEALDSMVGDVDRFPCSEILYNALMNYRIVKAEARKLDIALWRKRRNAMTTKPTRKK